MTVELPGYNLLYTIGSGSFASVKLGVKKKSLKAVAVKIFDTQRVEELVIKKEIMTHKSVEHPNIIKLQSFMRSEDLKYWFLILEYAPNGELFDIIEPDVGIEEDFAHFYFRQLISAVKYLHKLGIAHRDIKPENLFLDQNNNLKLGDFGLATFFRYKGRERLLETKCGTFQYIAPEVYCGSSYAAEPADLWSCGIVLTALLTGRLPWDVPSVECREFSNWENQEVIRPPWIFMNSEPKSCNYLLLCVSPQNRLTLSGIEGNSWFLRFNRLIDFTAGGKLSSTTLFCLLSDQTKEEDFIKFAEDVLPEQYCSKRLRTRSNESTCLTDGARTETVLLEGSLLSQFCTQPVGERSGVTSDAGRQNFTQPTQPEDMFVSQNLISPQYSQSARISQLVLRMTRFLSTEDPEKIFTLLKNILSTESYKYKSNDEAMMIKAQTFGARKALLVFTVQLHRLNDTFHVIHFKRLKGDGFEFKKIFKTIKDDMQHLIY
ncbi:serine/threonine-protein kinase Chk1-like isoform X2 [Zophobas morio]|uniref:serine/threonine-protein kinase Chk1-like isoform X2 n=1 Tax=Zophobas morio TaxID=2755281 RepID=UPI0030828675